MDKPILFSAEMILAILEGIKTMTRRVIMPQPTGGCWEGTCPYGSKGTTLWVRETTYLYGQWVKNGITKQGKPKYKFAWDKSKPVIYAADDKPDHVCKSKNEFGYFKRPSIFMPREACRLFLAVKDIRVEQLQDITREDAIAEGVNWETCPRYQTDAQLERMIKGQGCSTTIDYIGGFRKLWDSINAKRGYGWDSNPYVWVVEFERTEDPNVELAGWIHTTMSLM